MENYEKFAKKIAKEAGEVLKNNFRLEIKKEWKSDDSPVTETDLKVNKLVIDSVQKHFPDHSVLGEEESSFVENSKFTWVCDPVDGTMPFSHGVPIFSFSLALVEDGVPILGIVYDPTLDRTFFAAKGKGAYLNDHKITVSDANSLKNTVIDLDGSGRDIGLNYLEIAKNLRENGCHIFKFNSVIYGGMLVAAGEFSSTIFLKDTVHDMATIKIIVEEAGGKVTDVEGKEQRYDRKCNGIIASNGLVHDELIKIVNKK
jgi:fructose-1,6-bisphosphatase/inositol monophosphatase family enzyme